ncbi:MAG: hypothetical protein WBA67_13875 [Jannaschia sp.]
MLRLVCCLIGALALCPAVPARASDRCGDLPAGRQGACLIQAAEYGPDCALVPRATDRLSCWDRLHLLANCPTGDPSVETLRCGIRRAAVASVEAPRNVELVSATTEPDGWVLREDVSAFSGTTDVFLSVPSEGVTTCGRQVRASLILRCLDDQTAAYVVHDCATPTLGSDGWAVDLRFGSGPSDQVRMTPTAIGDGFGHFEYRAARTLIEALEAADALHLRFADIEGFSTELRFDVRGLSRQVGVLKRACGWSRVPPWSETRNRPGD